MSPAAGSRARPGKFTRNSRRRGRLLPSRLAAHPRQKRTMSGQNHIRIELTEEQKAQVKAATGKDARAIEFGVEELEERIAPMTRRIT